MRRVAQERVSEPDHPSAGALLIGDLVRRTVEPIVGHMTEATAIAAASLLAELASAQGITTSAAEMAAQLKVIEAEVAALSTVTSVAHYAEGGIVGSPSSSAMTSLATLPIPSSAMPPPTGTPPRPASMAAGDGSSRTPVVHHHWTINATDAQSFVRLVQTQGLDALVKAIAGNYRSAYTNMRAALGLSS